MNLTKLGRKFEIVGKRPYPLKDLNGLTYLSTGLSRYLNLITLLKVTCEFDSITITRDLVTGFLNVPWSGDLVFPYPRPIDRRLVFTRYSTSKKHIG